MASNREERLHSTKRDKKDAPRVLATSFPQLLTLSEKKKNLNTKTLITYRSPVTIGQKLTNCKNLALSNTKIKLNVRQSLASTVDFVVAMKNTTNPWSQLFHK